MRTSTVPGADGLDLVIDERGDLDAHPVLLLHGGGQTRHAWAGTAEALAGAGWLAVTADMRGHGESSWSPDGDYRLVCFAADAHALVARHDRPPFLIGASLGGFTAMLLAGEVEPGCLAGVVLVDIIPEMESAGSMRVAEFMQSPSPPTTLIAPDPPTSRACARTCASATAAGTGTGTRASAVEGERRRRRCRRPTASIERCR